MIHNHTNASENDNNNKTKHTIFIKNDGLNLHKSRSSKSKPQDNSEQHNKPLVSSVHNSMLENNISGDNKCTHDNKKKTLSTHCLIDSLSDEDDDEDDEDESYMILSLQDIMQSIPHNASKKPSIELQKTHTEWRWRFFDLNGRKLIEISKMDHNTKRIYTNNQGMWVEYFLKKEWDKFVVDARYYYIQKQIR